MQNKVKSNIKEIKNLALKKIAAEKGVSALYISNLVEGRQATRATAEIRKRFNVIYKHLEKAYQSI